MFEFITFVLLQLATLNSITQVGSSGWGNDAAKAQTSSVGSSGWGNDIVAPTGKTSVGSSGWGNDKP
jgi:hypothetical protein